jgi:hypothetical protein
LLSADEQQDFEVAAAQERQVLWLDVFKIDQDEIGFQEGFLVGANICLGGRLANSCGGGQFRHAFSGAGASGGRVPWSGLIDARVQNRRVVPNFLVSTSALAPLAELGYP